MNSTGVSPLPLGMTTVAVLHSMQPMDPTREPHSVVAPLGGMLDSTSWPLTLLSADHSFVRAGASGHSWMPMLTPVSCYPRVLLWVVTLQFILQSLVMPCRD